MVFVVVDHISHTLNKVIYLVYMQIQLYLFQRVCQFPNEILVYKQEWKMWIDLLKQAN